MIVETHAIQVQKDAFAATERGVTVNISRFRHEVAIGIEIDGETQDYIYVSLRDLAHALVALHNKPNT